MRTRWLCLCVAIAGTTLTCDVFAQHATCGLRTIPYPVPGVPAIGVAWVDWDSPFYGEIEIGDLIVAINGAQLSVTDLQEMSAGNTWERSFWESKGVKAGDSATFTVVRDGEQRQYTASLGRYARYGLVRNADGRMTFGADGPPQVVEGVFLNRFLDSLRGTETGTEGRLGAILRPYHWLANHKRAVPEFPVGDREIEPLREAVRAVAAAHGGRFVAVLQERQRAILSRLAGEARELTDADLEWRKLGDVRAAQVSAAADDALNRLKADYADQWLDEPFPAPDPGEQPVDNWVDKVVLFEPVEEHRGVWRESGETVVGVEDGVGYTAPRTYFAFGRYQGFYFMPRHTAKAWGLFEAVHNYGKQVAPIERGRATFQVLGRITEHPLLITDVYAGRSSFGLAVEPIAVIVGDRGNRNTRFLVDLRKVETISDCGTIAGFDDLFELPPIGIANDAAPGDVMEAFLAAIKYADYDLWTSLLADWEVRGYTDRPEEHGIIYVRDRVETVATWVARNAWETSREHMIAARKPAGLPSLVYDARVHWVSPTVTVYDPENLPRDLPEWAQFSSEKIEQVTVVVEFVGRFGDEYRTFYDTVLNAAWKLQRRGNGPWRVAEIKSL